MGITQRIRNRLDGRDCLAAIRIVLIIAGAVAFRLALFLATGKPLAAWVPETVLVIIAVSVALWKQPAWRRALAGEERDDSADAAVVSRNAPSQPNPVRCKGAAAGAGSPRW